MVQSVIRSFTEVLRSIEENISLANEEKGLLMPSNFQKLKLDTGRKKE